jgi:hypothetical protein
VKKVTRKKQLLLIIITNMYICVFGQYQTANWPLLSPGRILKIIPNVFKVDTLPNHWIGWQANASISDNQGNLMFFSLGEDCRNKHGDTMDNGCCLCECIDYSWFCTQGHPLPQGTMILPKPGSSNQYYLLIKDMESVMPTDEAPVRVTASLIDMNLNGGLGKVIQRAVPILSDTLCNTRMTACRHANGRDWWFVTHKYLSNNIFTVLITPDSIYPPQKQSIGAAGIGDAFGWSLFSPDGTVYATTTFNMGEITLLHFDRCTGTFSNYQTLSTDSPKTSSYLCFSTNSRFLYSGNYSFLFQYDLNGSNIDSTCTLLVVDTAGYPGSSSMVLMPDEKIYRATWTVTGPCLSVIDSPDLKAPDCAFHLRSMCVPGPDQIINTPNFANYNLGPLVGSGCDTLSGLPETARAEKEKLLYLFPNPATDYVVVDYGFTDWSKGDVELSISNELGQLMHQQKLPRYSGFQKIDVSRFSNGFYTASIKRSGSVVAVGKFAKQ